MSLRRLVCVVVALSSTTSASAYEKNVHYGLTYYLAREVGYTPENAKHIATMAWSIDANAETEPAKLAPPIVENIPLVGAFYAFIASLPNPQQKVLLSFHGFPLRLPSNVADDPVLI